MPNADDDCCTMCGTSLAPGEGGEDDVCDVCVVVERELEKVTSLADVRRELKLDN